MTTTSSFMSTAPLFEPLFAGVTCASVLLMGLPPALDRRTDGTSVPLRSLTGHPGLDPGFERIDEVGVRKRRRRPPDARVPCIETERVGFHVLDDLFACVAASIGPRVLDLGAELFFGPPLPQHGEWRGPPVVRARHEVP